MPKKKSIKRKNIITNQKNKANDTKKKKWISIEVKSLITSIINNSYKPKFNIDTRCYYSLGDSAITAQYFGALNFFIYLIIDLLGIFFNVKDVTVDVEPKFNDDFNIDTELNCILYINITQIIIIAILIIKNIKFKGGTR